MLISQCCWVEIKGGACLLPHSVQQKVLHYLRVFLPSYSLPFETLIKTLPGSWQLELWSLPLPWRERNRTSMFALRPAVSGCWTHHKPATTLRLKESQQGKFGTQICGHCFVDTGEMLFWLMVFSSLDGLNEMFSTNHGMLVQKRVDSSMVSCLLHSAILVYQCVQCVCVCVCIHMHEGAHVCRSICMCVW